MSTMYWSTVRQCMSGSVFTMNMKSCGQLQQVQQQKGITSNEMHWGVKSLTHDDKIKNGR